MDIRSFKISFSWNGDIVYATALPFQNEEFIFYDITMPDKVFTIKPNQIDSNSLSWTDLGGHESSLFTSAGKAIEKFSS